jgi:hypothetical protein
MQVAIKVELVRTDKADQVLERVLKLRNPELWQTRRKNRAKAKAKARRTGKPVTFFGWQDSIVRFGLADLNRPISRGRCDLYQDEMEAGRWHFTPDPIVVTAEGYVVNGQHRLAAADGVDWSRVEQVPSFVVVWGVDKKSALLMDEAKRSTDDRRAIALAFARAS